MDLSGKSAEFRHREKERLKRRVLSFDRFNLDRRQRIELLYRLADRYGSRIYPCSFCHSLVSAGSGCTTGECCQCRPDIFEHEKEILDRLPKRVPNDGHCPFFNHAGKNCTIYAERPLACRLYFNVAASHFSCLNPADETLMLLDNLKRHVEQILGPYLGGYVPPELPGY